MTDPHHGATCAEIARQYPTLMTRLRTAVLNADDTRKDQH